GGGGAVSRRAREADAAADAVRRIAALPLESAGSHRRHAARARAAALGSRGGVGGEGAGRGGAGETGLVEQRAAGDAGRRDPGGQAARGSAGPEGGRKAAGADARAGEEVR